VDITWSSWVFAWLAATCSIPLTTAVTQGFVGHGSIGAMLVFMFVLTFYRPRWQCFLGLCLFLYMGFSVYVTYMRDRDDFRDAVWGGEDYSKRVSVLANMFKNFEFLDFKNNQHLTLLDMRLNQNYLAGRAVENLETGFVPYAEGLTIWWAVIAPIPRILWPDKPVRAGGLGVVAYFADLEFAPGTSIGVGHVMELFINFGTKGVVVGFLIFGIVMRLADFMAAQHLQSGNIPKFTAWFLPTISFLNSGGSFVELAASAAASLVLVWLLFRFVFPQLQIQAYLVVPNQPLVEAR
jgi:hypothetical protein